MIQHIFKHKKGLAFITHFRLRITSPQVPTVLWYITHYYINMEDQKEAR